MNTQTKKPLNLAKLIVVSLGAALLASCNPTTSQEIKPIKIDGSSTVYPITKAVAGAYKANKQDPVDITVDFSGTGGGFSKFCAGQTDIQNASRPIQTKEMEACKEGRVAYIELPVAFDALAVVVNPDNNWINTITTEELKKIWEPAAEGKITRWNQVRPNFPDKPLNLFGPGADSGTFDYFTEAIVGEAGASRKDYVASEDDNILVEGVRQDPNALGYFGLAYYLLRPKEMRVLAIDSGKGPVLPSKEAVAGAIYQPLARPLFIYVNSASAQKNPALRDFIDFYLDKAPEIVRDVGYVPLPEEAYHIDRVTFHQGEVGTVFGGKSQFDLTIPELLRKRAQY
jgi:phosphate transport system substrate-binding protein